MIHRSLAAVAVASLVAMAACGDSGPEVASTTTTPTTTTTDDASGPQLEVGLVYATHVGSEAFGALDLYVPAEPADAPIVIGDYPALAEQGMIVVSQHLKEVARGGPEAVTADRDLVRRQDEHLACIIRFVRDRAADLGNDDPTVVLTGFSYGAAIATQTALFGDTLDERWDEFAARGGPARQLDCEVTEGSTDVDALIGIAGAYDVGMPIFDGEYGRAFQQEQDPEMQEFLAGAIGANPDLKIRLIHGTDDFVAVEGVEEFVALLDDAGYDVQLTTWPGGHDEPPIELLLAALVDVVDR